MIIFENSKSFEVIALLVLIEKEVRIFYAKRITGILSLNSFSTKIKKSLYINKVSFLPLCAIIKKSKTHMFKR